MKAYRFKIRDNPVGTWSFLLNVSWHQQSFILIVREYILSDQHSHQDHLEKLIKGNTKSMPETTENIVMQSGCQKPISWNEVN